MQNNGKVIPVQIQRTDQIDSDLAASTPHPIDLADVNSLSPHALPLQELVDRTSRLIVRHQLAIGMQPELFIEWRADPVLISRGYRILIFRNRNGFADTTRAVPVDQLGHGEQIVHATENSRLLLPLAEGDYYFTAMLASPMPMNYLSRKWAEYRKKFIGSMTRVAGFVQFHVHVPSLVQSTERIVRESEHYEARHRYVRSRERLDQKLGQTNAEFVVERHRLRAGIETSRRLSEFQEIKRTFQRHLDCIRSDAAKSAEQKKLEIAELNALLRAHLAAANFPAIDLRDWLQ